jgi:DNA repair exonuclease SbcCD ATPase subunit
MSDIPSFNDVCGTVVESLAETIQNREKIIIQLREDNARLQRVAADAVRKAESWKNEVEACVGDERKIVDLQAKVRNLHDEIRNLEQTAETTYENHKHIVSELTTQRDEARRLYCVFASNVEQNVTAEHIASQWGWDCFPLSDSDLAMEDAYLRKEREAESDSDPVTGVQYGDLV